MGDPSIREYLCGTSPNTPNEGTRRRLTPSTTKHEQWEGDHEDDDKETFSNDQGYEGRFREARNKKDSNMGKY